MQASGGLAAGDAAGNNGDGNNKMMSPGSGVGDDLHPPPRYQDATTSAAITVSVASPGAGSNSNSHLHHPASAGIMSPSPAGMPVAMFHHQQNQPNLLIDANAYQQQQQQQQLQQQQAFLTVIPQGYAFSSGAQNLIPIMAPAGNFLNPTPFFTGGIAPLEPVEAAVARPLSIISLFCCLQLWFSIPAIVFAYRRNKPKSLYNTSIALSVTAIVLGMVAAFVMMIFGLVMPFDYYGYRGGYYYGSNYYDHSYSDYRPSSSYANSNDSNWPSHAGDIINSSNSTTMPPVKFVAATSG